MVAGNTCGMRWLWQILTSLLLIPIGADAQTSPHTVSLPRLNGYKLHCSQQVFLERLHHAGLTIVPDSLTYSRYFYDTSVWAGQRTVEEKRQRVYYWRMLRFGYGQDTIPVVNLYFDTAYAPDNATVSSYPHIHIPIYSSMNSDEPATQKENKKQQRARWATYRKTHRRYTRMLRKEFVHKYIKA